MNKQESNTSFHLKGESTKTGKLPVSEQYLEDKEIQDQTEQLKNQTDISTEGLTETAILRLKAEQTFANKSNGISGATHSISTSYHEAVRDHQASLTRHRKNRHTFAIVRKTITLVVIFAILVAGITSIFVNKFAANHKKLKEFAFPLSMIVGMLGACVANLLI